MATHLKKGKPETLQNLAERAETYLEAHSSDILFGIDPKSSTSQGSRSPPPKRCHNCGSQDHLRNQCTKPQTPTSPKHPRAPQLPFPPRPVPFQRRPSYGGFKPTSPPREPPRCNICNKVGRVPRECRLKSTAAMEHHGYYRSHHDSSTSGSRATRNTITLLSFQNLIRKNQYRTVDLQHPQDQQRPPHHQYRRRDLRHRPIFTHLHLLIGLAGSTASLIVMSVCFVGHQQHTTAKHSLPYIRIVDGSIHSLQMPANLTARTSTCQSLMAFLRSNQSKFFETLDVLPS